MRYKAKASILAAALLLPVFLLTACEKEEPAKPASGPRPVKAVRVSDFANMDKRWFAGQAKGTREISLSFRVPGQLTDLPVVVGDEVAEGDPVAKLDSAPYKAEVDRIAANLSRAQATLDNAEQHYARDKQLFDKGHVAQARLDIRTAEMKQARGDAASYKAQLDRAKLSNEWGPPRESPLRGVTIGSELTGNSRVTYRNDRARDKPAKRRV